jgi:hypothetical protein
MWLTIYGTRPIAVPLGYAADFCRICRKITICTVNRMRMAPHLYFIPVGKGRTIGYQQQCHTCGAKVDASGMYFVRLSPSCHDPLEKIIAITNPGIREVQSVRLEIEDRLTRDANALTPEERQKLMREAFEIASDYYDNRSGADGLRLLSLALRPLEPREEEIHDCLERYRRRGTIMGARLRTAQVMDLVYEHRKPRNPDAFDY